MDINVRTNFTYIYFFFLGFQFSCLFVFSVFITVNTQVTFLHVTFKISRAAKPELWFSYK